MSDKPTILGGLWRFISFWKVRKALGLVRAADAQFTSTTQGISDAFDIAADKLKGQYQSLRDAVAQVEMVGEQKRQRLEELNKQEKQALTRRDGALKAVEASRAAGDKAEESKATAAFTRYQADIQRIEAEQKEIEASLIALEANTKQHMAALTKLQAEVQKLPQEKAEQIAKFVSNTQLIQLNDRLGGLQTSIDMGPIDAVRKANAELSAKAVVSGKLAGTDVVAQDDEYEALGAGDTANDTLEQMLAARNAAKGVSESTEADAAERPEIKA